MPTARSKRFVDPASWASSRCWSRIRASSTHSGCPLGTAFGTMHGTYQMVTPKGEHFDVEIAAFALSLPYAIN